MKSLILSCMLAFSASATFGQGYQFTEVVTVPATPVKNQAATGTCWCFATCVAGTVISGRAAFRILS